MKRHESYTVAVICAIGFEMSAVRYMLDREHPRLPPKQGDSNLYVLGELSGHNVVLACLPGIQGKGAAATVATNIARTFPSIEWRFLVGIGGGVPSDKHDLRLGDVVVSMPEGQYGGVIQYDLGKDTEDDFQLKGFLWPPPAMLRSAVEMMQSDHLMADNKVKEFLLQMLQRGPKLSIYQRPPTELDILFHADYPHVESGSACEHCDKSKTIHRSPRQFSGPEVHYGLIASGDRVMRSAAKRNASTSNLGDILCFEMEAAGIATEFPCIVIRGISDYADSHKNDSWQRYAAAAAAASAKELLSYIDANITPELLVGDATSALSDPSALPSGNKEVSQQLSGQGIVGYGPVSVGRDIRFATYNQIMPPSDPIHDLWRDFLEDLCESDPATDMSRIAEDKGGLLLKCFDWILDNDELKTWQQCENTRLLWVKGDPGKGKTMLMIGLVRHLQVRLSSQNCSLAFFFCQNTDSRLNNDVSVLRGLVWMLLKNKVALSKHIPDEYRLKSKEKRKAMFEAQNRNLFPILTTMLDDMLSDAELDATYLLLDALDECQDSGRLVKWITQVASKPGSKAKWLVSSRFSLLLDRALRPTECQQKLDLELNDNHISRAVAQYIKLKVEGLAKKCKYDDALQRKVQAILEERAESTFLWVALICPCLERVRRLQVESEIDKFPPGLPALYDRMVDIIDQDNDKIICKKILRAVTLAYRPLALKELVTLAELPTEQPDDVRELVNLCSSFVIFREGTVRILHQSAKDYLEKHYEVRLHAAGASQGHADIATYSIKAMSLKLKRNMYNLDYGFKPKDMIAPNPDPLASIQYSCVFWADHLAAGIGNSLESKRVLADDGEKSSENSQLTRFLEDVETFIWSYGSIIGRAPLQTYASALVFSPTTSLVRVTQWKLRLPFIKMMTELETHWDIHRKTVEGLSGSVESVAFSPDGKTLASTYWNEKTIRLWDTATGIRQQTIKGHSSAVRSVAFSPDGKTLALTSHFETTIRLWDIATGIQLQTLKGHSDIVGSVAFSPNGKTLASGSNDKTIWLWDTTTGIPQQTIEGYSSAVRSVAFSPDGKTLALTSYFEPTIWLWDTATGIRQQTIEGHSSAVRSVAFSPDGKTLALTSYFETTIRLWDTATGIQQQTLKGHSDIVGSVAFSPNGKTLASGSNDKTIRLWDTTTGIRQQTIEGHSSAVRSVAFSPDGKTLASGSNDKTIRLWDTTTGIQQQTIKGHDRTVRFMSVAFSPDGKTLALGSNDKTIRLWDTATGIQHQTLKGQGPVRSVAFSPDGKTLASTFPYETTIWLWDTAMGIQQQTLKGHGGEVRLVAFSPDGRALASVSYDKTIRLWDTATGIQQQRLKVQGTVRSVAFSPDGKTLASGSDDKTIRLWDTATGFQQQTLKGQEVVRWVAFSPDGKTLASGSDDKTIRLWDMVMGIQWQTLEGHRMSESVAFSPDGRYLTTDYGSLQLPSTCVSSKQCPDKSPSDHHLYVDEEWITLDGKNTLWLPADYRTSAVAVHDGKVALGHRLGGLRFLEFKFA
ncbi:Pfs, NACHT and WD domain protein [Pochonia chlamydosporia 170]|uniref:Mitochondrial division protein 1 n=1 Tax=Pochonia chlamydosporia 170 TaxID=1380566 RepID=A0A219AR46_METCM|nr:Pfs, NACHT and WD domain protein [Pochonia chlamydosporia 170]OWT43263.1 Pfs, NACHT and WD domain protein [Pochonia chlamydosporia 170]